MLWPISRIQSKLDRIPPLTLMNSIEWILEKVNLSLLFQHEFTVL